MACREGQLKTTAGCRCGSEPRKSAALAGCGAEPHRPDGFCSLSLLACRQGRHERGGAYPTLREGQLAGSRSARASASAEPKTAGSRSGVAKAVQDVTAWHEEPINKKHD